MPQGQPLWPDQQFPTADHGSITAGHVPPSLGSGGGASRESDSRSPASSSHFGVSEPLAHEVGMLSLTNSTEAKYVGPSSGVPFARLIFSAIPQSQGLPASWTSPEGGSARRRKQPEPLPRDWTSDVDLQHFVDAYFETYQPLHPFLDEDAISDRLERLQRRQSPALNSLPTPRLVEVEAVLAPVHSVQMFLIIALGARVLEVRLSSDFMSEQYLASAMQRLNSLSLHDNLDGLQVMLLLALSSFYFENGPNAWFLTSSLIASCLDIGLQRQCPAVNPALSVPERNYAMAVNDLKRAVFWSVYSLERTLSVVLGRPLTLRDEAIDVEFPGEVGPGPSSVSPGAGINRSTGPGRNDDPLADHPPKSARISAAPYTAAQYSFRFDQITAEIKLVLHRVVNLPTRFPWINDVDRWREETHQRCTVLLNDLKEDLRRRSRRGLFDCTTRSLELKYHHCLMLLHRPSPAISQPSIDSWKTCYHSAVATVLINSDLHRFSKLSNSWLTAHTIFVSGITFLYCLWAKPEIKRETPHATFTSVAATCTTLLEYLGKTWSVAADVVAKFERLVSLTSSSWAAAQESQNSEVAARHSLLSMSESQVMPETTQNGAGHQDGPTIPPAPLNPEASVVPDIFTGDETDVFKPESFFGEIGDMSAWFDLDWLVGAGP